MGLQRPRLQTPAPSAWWSVSFVYKPPIAKCRDRRKGQARVLSDCLTEFWSTLIHILLSGLTFLCLIFTDYIAICLFLRCPAVWLTVASRANKLNILKPGTVTSIKLSWILTMLVIKRPRLPRNTNHLPLFYSKYLSSPCYSSKITSCFPYPSYFYSLLFIDLYVA